MTKHQSHQSHRPSKADPHRRPRAEIDRNYYYGDVLIKTGVACGVVLLMIAAYTPFSLRGAIESGMFEYLSVIGVFAAIGLACVFFGRRLRREATHWDFD